MCAISIKSYNWDWSESERKRPKPTPLPHMQLCFCSCSLLSAVLYDTMKPKFKDFFQEKVKHQIDTPESDKKCWTDYRFL